MQNIFSFLLLGLVINFSLIAQDIRINEVVSSNSEYFDEDGDAPNWLELHNFGVTPVSLLNWGVQMMVAIYAIGNFLILL